MLADESEERSFMVDAMVCYGIFDQVQRKYKILEKKH